MYMNLITEAYVSKNTQDFAYYSRFFIQHLFWTMVRAPDKSGYHIFEEKDLDARLEKTDFCIKTPENRQAFRAFLEHIQRESMMTDIFNQIQSTQVDDTESIQNMTDYYFGLKSSHKDFKPTFKMSRVFGRIK